MTIAEQINKLKIEKNAVILAHYYTEPEVQAIADYVGDSYYLSKLAVDLPQKLIVYCGVSFMGESACILNPDKKVLMPDMTADCPMAHMASIEQIAKVRKNYPDVAVVCYINSTAELKEHADVCVTSANALKIVEALPNPYIYMIPDRNLAGYIASKLPEKQFIFNQGYCPIHHNMKAEEIIRLKELHPDAEILCHPECCEEIVSLSDYVGSTSQMIQYATQSNHKEFILGTEVGVLFELEKQNPDKTFYFPKTRPVCVDMKKITLEKIHKVLCEETNELHISAEQQENAKRPLSRMLELAK